MGFGIIIRTCLMGVELFKGLQLNSISYCKSTRIFHDYFHLLSNLRVTFYAQAYSEIHEFSLKNYHL